MFVNNFLLISNPFFDAYIHSDFLGRLIFISLVALSVCSWIVLIHKLWLTIQAKRYSSQFYDSLKQQKTSALSFEFENKKLESPLNAFLTLYLVLKKHTIDILNKNRAFSKKQSEGPTAYLTAADIDFVDSHLNTTIATQTKFLEKNLFILSTTVSLAPFLGLLGTVWGILTTFSELQNQTGSSTNEMVLGGLSLALATTVLGLLDAIPALIGYNYLKNAIRDFQTEMECFSNEILAHVEIQYRKVDLG